MTRIWWCSFTAKNVKTILVTRCIKIYHRIYYKLSSLDYYPLVSSIWSWMVVKFNIFSRRAKENAMFSFFLRFQMSLGFYLVLMNIFNNNKNWELRKYKRFTKKHDCKLSKRPIVRHVNLMVSHHKMQLLNPIHQIYHFRSFPGRRSSTKSPGFYFCKSFSHFFLFNILNIMTMIIAENFSDLLVKTCVGRQPFLFPVAAATE